MPSRSIRLAVFIVLPALLTLLCGCDLEVIPDNFTGGGGPNNGAPRACFTADRTVCTVGDCDLLFDAGCSAGAVTYRWDFDGDATFDLVGAGEQTPTHTYPEAGTFTVRLEVQDDRNRTADTTLTITVNAAPINTFAETDPTVTAGRVMEILEDGSFLVAGGVGQDIYLRRIGPDGGVILNQRFTLPASPTVEDLAVLSDGTYVVVANYFDDGDSHNKGSYLRVSSAGITLNGPTTLPFSERGRVSTVTELPDGSLLFGGTETRQFTPGVDVVLLRLSPNLTTLFWQQKLVGSGEAFLDLGEILARDDGFVLAGSSFTLATGARGMFARYDLAGELTTGQPRYFGSASEQRFRAMTELGPDDYLMAGLVAPGNNDVLLVRTDADGNAADGFPVNFAAPGDQLVYAAATTADGGAILAGEDGGNVMLLRVNAAGDELWKQTDNLTGASGFLDVRPAPDGGFYACGYRTTSLYYAKTDAEGRVN